MSSPKILIPIAILALLAGAYFFTKKDATAEQTNVIKKTLELADFTVKATATGELKAKRSEKIRGPAGLRQANIYQLTISDMVPEGTIVKEGDYVAKLDRSELDTKLKDIQTEIENPLAQKLLSGGFQPDSTIRVDIDGELLVIS